jgi:hypothetical protein
MTARVYRLPCRPMSARSPELAARAACPVVRMPTLSAHLARAAHPYADLVIGAMAARGTRVAGVAIVGDEYLEAYGLAGVWELASMFSRRPGPFLPPAVFVVTDHVAGWVAPRDIEAPPER